VIKAYFNKRFHEQAMLLTEVLESLNLFNPTILNAIYWTPRHMLLPGNLAPLAYWNRVTPIRGTVALTGKLRHQSEDTKESLLTDGKYIRGLSGMTCVLPAWTIRKVLNMPVLRK
jgi:hypothetical protein